MDSCEARRRIVSMRHFLAKSQITVQHFCIQSGIIKLDLSVVFYWYKNALVFSFTMSFSPLSVLLSTFFVSFQTELAHN